ncbi:MAG: beta-lactamase family protein [Bacteroidales bacterium]|nr:beta-lactamase family protein [Bacteroidales bacterium]
MKSSRYFSFFLAATFLLQTAGSCHRDPLTPDEKPDPPVDSSVVRIVETGEGFDSFGAAVLAANASAAPVTVRLLVDCASAGVRVSNPSWAKVTIDLAGHSLEMLGELKVLSAAEIADSSTPGDGTPGKGFINAADSPALSAANCAELTISGGNIICTKDSTYTVRIEDGARTIVNGPARIVSEKYRCLYLYGSETARSEASLTIKDGWFECAEGHNIITTTRSTNAGAHRICLLNVSGGHFRHAGSDYSATRRCIYRGYDNCTAKVSGGFFDTGEIYRHGSQSVHDYTAEGAVVTSTQTDFPQEYAAGYTHYVKMERGPEAADAAVRRLFEESKAANLVVMAYKGDEMVYSAAYGYRCKKKGCLDTLEVHDIYRLASISKSFTGAAAMLLVEQGKLDLKAKVNDYLALLPEGKRFTVSNPKYPDVPITVEMLLNHTSTIGGSNYAVEVFSKNITYSSDKPGEVYDYSNMGSVVAGAVVELASGERLDKFVKSNLLDKIGMPHSGFNCSLIDTMSGPKFTYIYTSSGSYSYETAYPPMLTAAQEANYVLGYNTGFVSPAGNMKSNAEELCRWARTLQMGGLSPDGVRVLSEKSVRDMVNNTGPGSRYGYFLYTNVSVIPGQIRTGHNGGYNGAHTTMYFGMSFDASGTIVPPEKGSADDWRIVTLSSGGSGEDSLGDGITKALYYTLIER